MYKSTVAYVTGAMMYTLFTTPSINSGMYQCHAQKST